MKFKYCAFIENTPEMREYLERIGYKLSPRSQKDGDLICTYAHGVYWIFYNHVQYLAHFRNKINCLGNPSLFKAVTAVRDDSDMGQWFTDGINWFICRGDEFENWYHFENKEKLYFDGKLIHKATDKELIEHFKK